MQCSARAPVVLFGQLSPFRRSGSGAIAFVGGPCGDRPRLSLVAIDGDDTPGQARPLLRPASGHPPPATLAAATATSRGQMALVASSSGRRQGLQLYEATASGGLVAPRSLRGARPPAAATSAYLGDAAIASSDPTHGGIAIRMQRHFQGGFAAPSLLPGPRGTHAAPRALTVALDFRADAMAVWWQDGWLYARERRATAGLGPLQRLARAGAAVQVACVISDDGRAIVAWLDPRGSSDARAHEADLYLAISGPGMRLGRARLVERLRVAEGVLPPRGSVELVRLSSERVTMGWTGTVGGRLAVRIAAIGLLGMRTPETLSPAGEDAVLQGLATGPRDDLLAVWSEGSKRGRAKLMASWAAPAASGPLDLGAASDVSSLTVAPTAERRPFASAAIDPDSDRAVVSWRGADGRVAYAVGARAGSPGR